MRLPCSSWSHQGDSAARALQHLHTPSAFLMSRSLHCLETLVKNILQLSLEENSKIGGREVPSEVTLTSPGFNLL